MPELAPVTSAFCPRSNFSTEQAGITASGNVSWMNFRSGVGVMWLTRTFAFGVVRQIPVHARLFPADAKYFSHFAGITLRTRSPRTREYSRVICAHSGPDVLAS